MKTTLPFDSDSIDQQWTLVPPIPRRCGRARQDSQCRPRTHRRSLTCWPEEGQLLQGSLQWVDEILHHLRSPGMLIAL